jgi:hypothetical protein
MVDWTYNSTYSHPRHQIVATSQLKASTLLVIHWKGGSVTEPDAVGKIYFPHGKGKGGTTP